jgi:hypothetical protein
MDLVEALRNDREAVSRLEVLLRQLSGAVEPHSAQLSDLLHRMEVDSNISIPDDEVVLVFLAARSTGITDALKAIFGDRIHFHKGPGPSIVDFRPESEKPNWWSQLFET